MAVIANRVDSLVDICIARTASLILENYWPAGYYEPQSAEEFNPFVAFPTDIIEELTSTVIHGASSSLNISHLYLLLSSGRIRCFRFENVQLLTEHFVAILSVLAIHGNKLTKLVLRHIHCREPEAKYELLRSRAIEFLLSVSPNMEYIEVDKWFDFKAFHYVNALKHLDICFAPTNKLFDLLPQVDDEMYIPNETLSFFSIFEDHRHRISVEEMAFILQHCPELISVRNNIATALELLHGEELYCGHLTKRYKLQTYVLGSVYMPSDQATASVSVIQIASITCPDTRQLDVLVNDHHAIVVFVDFKKLDSFLIQWEKITSGDFRLGLKFVIENIGSQLKDLSILNFSNIDFETIGRCCPNLCELKVEFDSEVPIRNPCTKYFKCLKKLYLQYEGHTGIDSNTLILLLSGCTELTTLYVEMAPALTDSVMMEILKLNPFPNLKEVTLSVCNLDRDGLQSIVECCQSLEYLSLESSLISLEEAAEVIHNINPLVLIVS